MRLIVPLDRNEVELRLASAADSPLSALYAFGRPYGYDVSLVDDPEPIAHPIAKVRIFDSGGFVELNVRLRSDSLAAAIALSLLSAFLLWGTYHYDGEFSAVRLISTSLSLAGVPLATLSLIRSGRLRSELRRLFPEARPAA